MTRIPHAAIPTALKKVAPFEHKTVRGLTFLPDSGLPARGRLTEQEYAPLRAAAEAARNHEPSAALRYLVTVDGEAVAYLLGDGQARTIGQPSGATALRVQRMAADHLGASEETQVELADGRGDAARMSSAAFRARISAALRRAERLSGEPEATGAEEEAQRRAAAGEAAGLLAVFKDRHTRECVLWHELHAQLARRGGPLPASQFAPGEWVSFRFGMFGDGVLAAVVVPSAGDTVITVLAGKAPVRLHDTSRVTPYDRLLPQTRELWAREWQAMGAAERPAS